MAKDDWTYSDPLPELLALLKILRQCPDNSAEIAVHNARLKGIMKDAREGAAAIPGAELGLNDQVEVIKRLQARLDAQSRICALSNKSESSDVTMTTT